MKKHSLTAVALLVALALAGCSNGNAAKTTTAASSAAPETTTTAAETTTAETTTAAPETTEAPETTTEAQPTEDGSDKTAIFSAGGTTLYLEDGKLNDWQALEYDFGLARLSTETYFDSDTNPDYFVTDEFTYKGETVPLGTIEKFTVGDKIGNLTVTEASTSFMPPYGEDGADVTAKEGWNVFNSHLTFDGEITVTGIARYYFDEQYTIGSGDIHIIPNASYAGLPVAIELYDLTSQTESATGFGTASFDMRGNWDNSYYGGELCVYTDAPEFRAGNLNMNYSDRAEMYELFDGGNANCTKKVEVTLTDVRISFSDQFGTSHCSATIKDIKAIG